MKLLSYKNGNATITIEQDGTRTIEYHKKLLLDYPIAVDIKISSTCSFADNLCKSFCHESALVKGQDCDFDELLKKIVELPTGVELAIGVNQLTKEVVNFFSIIKDRIINITINQGHLVRDQKLIEYCINNDLIKGLGISYRPIKWNVPQFIIDYPNTIFNTIIGIDNFDEVFKLPVNKINVLGEKLFGFNNELKNHNNWRWNIHKLFDKFQVVGFDNLAIEQLKLQRFFNKEQWDEFYNFEESIYIDAVNKVYKPSSRSKSETDWSMTIKEYYEQRTRTSNT